MKETIKGSYTFVKMPDGTETLMEKLNTGEWVTVQERLNNATDKFNQQFNDTTTVPNDWKEPTSENTYRKDNGSIKTLLGNNTQKHLHAHLIEVLGSPTEIIKNNKLFKPVSDPSIRRMVTKIIEALNVEEWNLVLKIINNQN